MIRKLHRNKISAKTLRRHFDQFLNQPPKPESLNKRKSVYLRIDGRYFGRWGCLLLYKTGKDLIYWNFVKRESFNNYLFDLIKIKELGYDIVGVTSDWHKSLVLVVKHLFRDRIPHQRCLVHTQRLSQSLLTKKPKTEAGKDLLDIVLFLNKIDNHYEAHLFKNRLKFWQRDYGHLIKERSCGVKEDGSKTWWYTHKHLRRVFRTLALNLDHLFLYLNYQKLPKDTNGLESEFSHLKQKVNLHRGLKRSRKVKAVYWFCHFKSLERKGG